MSLTTLGAQLAAINAPGKSAGSALPTSRRHEDAIGRGISHSVQIGHSISDKSHLYKPSIIYEDARKASDVPLATIRENCISSLRELETIDPEFGSFIEKLCRGNNIQERGLLTVAENDKVDTQIEDLLYRLSLHMSSKSATASCLHVIEYLLRRYDLHIRSKTASAALLATLPHHEEPFFLRLIQLVDLASIPSWSFLRPYAIPGAKLARSAIAKQAARDTALVREICRLTQRNARLPKSARSLAFTAALLVEVLNLQTQKTGNMDEKTCQCLLPYVVAACRQSKLDGYQNWGHVLASTVVESSLLAEEPRNVLVISILQGLGDAKESTVANGLLVALTVLAQPLDGVNTKFFSLPMCRSSTSSLGFAIDKNVIYETVKLQNFSSLIGQLYKNHGFIDFAHWIASTLVVGWRRLEKQGKKQKQIQGLITSLIEEPMLRSLWQENDGAWVESFCAFVLLNTQSILKADGNNNHEFAKSILEVLRKLDIAAYEKGIKYALQSLDMKKRRKVAAWAGLGSFASKASSNDESNSVDLTSRMAMDHPDAGIRLEGIKKLLDEEGSDDLMEVDGTDSIQHVLFRRFVVDDDAMVVTKAAEALAALLEKGSTIDSKELAQGSLQTLYRWTEEPKTSGEDNSEFLIQILRVVAFAGRIVAEDGNDPTFSARILESLAAHMVDETKSVSMEAKNLLKFVLTGKTGSKDHAHLLVSDGSVHNGFMRKLSQSRRAERMLRRRAMRVVLESFTDAMKSEEQKMDDTVVSSTAAMGAVEYCNWMIQTKTHEFTQTEMEAMLVCLKGAAKVVATSRPDVPKIFMQLAEHKGKVFSEVLGPFVKSVAESVKRINDEDVSASSVLLEVALSTSSNIAIRNLLSVASQCLQSGKDEIICDHGFIHLLSLIAHVDESVRKDSISILCKLEEGFMNSKNKEWKFLVEICRYIKDNKSSAIMGGSSFLPSCLTAVLGASKHGKAIQKCLLCLCVSAIATCTPSKPTTTCSDFAKGWLAPAEAIGAQNAVIAVLQATELAGETAFPLNLRWQLAGKPILELLDGAELKTENEQPMLVDLINSVVQMLKGLKINDPASHGVGSSIIISSGPGAGGGRSRSYSFSKNDKSTFLEPYPRDMYQSILTVLEKSDDKVFTNQLRESILKLVLSSRSWGEGVFAKLPRKTRQIISLTVLKMATEETSDTAEATLFSLPMNCGDLVDLLGKDVEQDDRMVSVVYLSDFATANVQRLSEDLDVPKLISAFFQNLSKLKATGAEEDDATEFARRSILVAVLEILNELTNNASANGKLEKEKSFGKWIDLLLSMIGAGKTKSAWGFESSRNKRNLLTLLSTLCTRQPSLAGKTLISTVRAIVTNIEEYREATTSGDFFNLIVPAFFQKLPGLTLSKSELLNEFILASRKKEDEEVRLCLYQGFLDAISKIEGGDEKLHAIGTAASACLANEVFFVYEQSRQNTNIGKIVQKTGRLLSRSTASTKLFASLSMLGYGKAILEHLVDGEDSSNQSQFMPLRDILTILEGKPVTDLKQYFAEAKERTAILCTTLVSAVRETVSLPVSQRFIKKIKGETSTMILRLWQDLLLTQTACHSYLGGEMEKESTSFWESISEITSATLTSLHGNLPSHVFLAFASNLIKDGGTDDLRSRALQLIADRSVLLSAADPEASLYRDMLPFLSSLVKGKGFSKGESTLQQSALVAIESITRSLCLSPDEATLSKRQMDSLVVTMTKSADLMDGLSHIFDNGKADFSQLDAPSRQVVCSASLCAATVVRACGLRSLPALPKMMKSQIRFLEKSNQYLEANDGKASFAESHAKLVQLSILRGLISIAESLPQFLSSYLSGLFSPSALPSRCLRLEDDDTSIAVKTAVLRLENLLATRVPARQLVPIISKSIVSSAESIVVLPLISVMTASIKASKALELGGLVNAILTAATAVFENRLISDDNVESSNFSNEMLMSLVLKLSEVQLRSLYSKLRDWTSESSSLDRTKSISRKLAFWNFSYSLGKQLKAIYLPCLSTVFSDAVDELEHATLLLCRKDEVKLSGGKKRQRVGIQSDTNYDSNSIKVLQALLHCLEVSLKSDARDGGTWVREGDSQRFNKLLTPLGKLLHAKFTEGTSSLQVYQSAVQGVDQDTGSVTACIVALASAAGDEQLWKPLNHSVLQACSDENRSEVRKAGVMCLLSLVRSIGEEYMILIPECLPVLSELLEDSDEEIAGLAQDCISFSEELLGESLQDSL